MRRSIRNLTGRWRKLPDFIIIGAQKSGTSSLYYYLRQHPSFSLSTQKEIHYFDRNLHRGLSWYKAFFPLKTSKKKTGEASPYYLFSESAPQELYKVKPDVKLIVLLRNPIDRAYSQYHMTARQVGSPDYPDFEQAIGPDSTLEAERHFLSRGRYAEYIKHWLRYFDREQFLFIKSEDFFTDTRTVLRKIYNWLEVEEIFPRDIVGREVGSYPHMSTQTKAVLEDYYRIPNQELIALLGTEFRW